MKEQHDVNALCLDVFAGVSAIVSHDIKNVLAIINESAGLLDDLACMSGEDAGVPADRIQVTTASIAAQVTRANIIMKNLNRFAHSGDIPTTSINIKETLARMIALTTRKAATRSISLRIECNESLQLHTQPRVFEALLYQLLLTIYEIFPAGGVVLIEAGTTTEQTTLIFRPDSPASVSLETFPGESHSTLATALHAVFSSEDNRITVTLPANKHNHEK
jgi:light-regulated signal transduction histidine kinase (bacteriophytochrome)